MLDKKQTGSYYTPKVLSDFLISHIFQNYIHSDNLKILEPSCGDGQFISSILNVVNVHDFTNIAMTVCDIDKTELKKTKRLIQNFPTIKNKPIHGDYLDFFLKNENKYSLIIGNPPYIRKKNMKENQITTCENVREKIKKHSTLINSKARINNIWTAFVESAILSLEDNGIMCFVIPSEIMHVNYTKELRRLIQSEFDRVEIFAFNELIFEGIQQDVVALIGVKGIPNKDEHGVSFYQVDHLKDLEEPKFTELHSNIHRLNLDKWTNYILSDDELNSIENYKNKFQPIKKYCKRAQVGIVSAANEYFIISKSDVLKNKLNQVSDLVKPILSKGSVLPNVLNYTNDDYLKLVDKNQRVSFLQFKDLPKKELGKIENLYLAKGELKIENSDKGELHKRYKMLKRENWYHIPSVWYSAGLFVKRSHMFPKIVVNSANSLATDSFYRLEMNSEYDIKNLAFSFYNTLTFVLAELEGRFYGGGVLELTPNEFKNLAIPYSANITSKEFNKLDLMIRQDKPIDSILDYTDNILFRDIAIDIKSLRSIRLKLVNRRIKYHDLTTIDID